MHALAKYLYTKRFLTRMISSYPLWKLKDQNLPVDSGLIHTIPWLVTPYLALNKMNMLHPLLEKKLSGWSHELHDKYAKNNLIQADIFHGLSCHNLSAGRNAKKMGIKYVCDHGSSHIKFQSDIIKEEKFLTGIEFINGGEINSKVIETEQLEYLESDHIFVASKFSKDTFLKKNIPSEKISVIPYGVDLSEFYPIQVQNDQKFRVVFVGALSMRKGIHYLVRAFRLANIKNSELILIGKKCVETDQLISTDDFNGRIIVTGIIPRVEILVWLSRSTVFVLPSIEDGFGLVLLEAMACGLPVIATENTGGPDCIIDGVNGFIVPIRSPQAIMERLIYLYENPEKAKWMANNSINSVSGVDGWGAYGEKVLEVYRNLLEH